MDGEAGALAGAGLNLDPAVVLFDDAVTDAQAQSGSLTHRLGREERVEDALADRCVDPAAVVLNIDADPHGLGLGLGMHRDHTGLRRTGVDGVGQQVDDDLMDPGCAAADRRQGPQVHDDPHSLACGHCP